jgi:hypothetical protein
MNSDHIQREKISFFLQKLPNDLFKAKNKSSVNWIIRLMLSLLIQPKVIQLSGGNCTSILRQMFGRDYHLQKGAICPSSNRKEKLTFCLIGSSMAKPTNNPFNFASKLHWKIMKGQLKDELRFESSLTTCRRLICVNHNKLVMQSVC